MWFVWNAIRKNPRFAFQTNADVVCLKRDFGPFSDLRFRQTMFVWNANCLKRDPTQSLWFLAFVGACFVLIISELPVIFLRGWHLVSELIINSVSSQRRYYFYMWYPVTEHNITRARAPQASSQAPPLLLETFPAGHPRPRRACSQPEAKTVKRKREQVRT